MNLSQQGSNQDHHKPTEPSVKEVLIDQTIDQTYDTTANDSYLGTNMRDEDLRGAIISRTSTIKRQRPRFNDELFGRVQWVLIMDIVNNLLNLLFLAILAVEVSTLGILAVSYLGLFIFSLYVACEYSSVRSVEKKIQTLKLYNKGRRINLGFVALSLGFTLYFGSTYIYNNYINRPPETPQTPTTSPSLSIYIAIGALSLAVILLAWNLFHIVSNQKYFNGSMDEEMKSAQIPKNTNKGLNDSIHSEEHSTKTGSV